MVVRGLVDDLVQVKALVFNALWLIIGLLSSFHWGVTWSFIDTRRSISRDKIMSRFMSHEIYFLHISSDVLQNQLLQHHAVYK